MGKIPLTLYHGTGAQFRIHEGQCWTDSEDSAKTFAGRLGLLASADIFPEGLVFERDPAGHDPVKNFTPADDPNYLEEAASRGVDILVYADIDAAGNPCTCYRLLTDEAMSAFMTDCTISSMFVNEATYEIANAALAALAAA